MKKEQVKKEQEKPVVFRRTDDGLFARIPARRAIDGFLSQETYQWYTSPKGECLTANEVRARGLKYVWALLGR